MVYSLNNYPIVLKGFYDAKNQIITVNSTIKAELIALASAC